MTSEETPACPYARALKESAEVLPGVAEVQKCPAFQNNECPFKGLASEQIAEKLRQIPPSHLQDNGTFHKALEFFHHHQQSPTAGCPVKHALPADWSFDQAMEEFSLSSIMGRLAREWEVLQDGESSGSEDEASTKVGPPPQANATTLSQALKSGTAAAHEAAESVHFVKNFIRGKIDRKLYALLVAQLFHVYTKLEEALDAHAPTHFPICHFPTELSRTATLQEDVEFWHTTSQPPISPATQDYIDRLTEISNSNPLLLLSHAYTRYMGDLSGGKVLSRVARRALNLAPDDAGLAFYHFEHVTSFKVFKDQYRACLNALKLNEKEITALVQEANVAFLLNMRLFEELDVIDNVPGAALRPLDEVYRFATTSSHQGVSNDAVCPFLRTSKKKQGVCPWPFILLHDPRSGMKQWQTWLVIGIVATYAYQTLR